MVDLSDSRGACALFLPPRENINDSDTLIRKTNLANQWTAGYAPPERKRDAGILRNAFSSKSCAGLVTQDTCRLPLVDFI